MPEATIPNLPWPPRRLVVSLVDNNLQKRLGVNEGMSYEEINARIRAMVQTLGLDAAGTAQTCSDKSLRGPWHPFGHQ